MARTALPGKGRLTAASRDRYMIFGGVSRLCKLARRQWMTRPHHSYKPIDKQGLAAEFWAFGLADDARLPITVP